MTFDVKHGVSRDAQESSFMNATLQETDDGRHAYSIAVYLKLPAGLTDRQVERRIQGAVSLLAYRDDTEVVVKIGPNEREV